MQPRAIVALIVLLVWWLPTMAAEKIYRHVDKDGKVHYSQVKPGQETASEVKVAPAPPVDPRNLDPRQCLSYECYAEQLKKDRLQREKGYAEIRQREEQEALKHHRNASSSSSKPGDDYYRSLCRNSGAKMDCNDTDKIRKEMEAQRQQYEHWKSNPRNYGQPPIGPTIAVP